MVHDVVDRDALADREGRRGHVALARRRSDAEEEYAGRSEYAAVDTGSRHEHRSQRAGRTGGRGCMSSVLHGRASDPMADTRDVTVALAGRRRVYRFRD